MPLSRSPPGQTSPASTVFASPLQHYSSDTNVSEIGQEAVLCAASSLNSILSRSSKRRRGNLDGHDRVTGDICKMDLIDTLYDIQKRQDEKFDMVLSSINEVKTSMDLMSSKYEEAMQRINILEEERKNDKSLIQELEKQVEILQRSARSTSLEIRNVSQNQHESKDDLIKIILKTAAILNTPLELSDIKDVYRINTKSATKPIIADFVTVSRRDNLLSSFKKYNKDNQQNKLSTSQINVTGPRKPLYISENFTQRERKLYYLAREYAKNHSYAFCWTSKGRIYLRKSEGSPHFRITSEADLDKLVNAQ